MKLSPIRPSALSLFRQSMGAPVLALYLLLVAPMKRSIWCKKWCVPVLVIIISILALEFAIRQPALGLKRRLVNRRVRKHLPRSPNQTL